MERDLKIVLVLVIAAAVVLAVGVYLLLPASRPGETAPPVPTAQVWKVGLLPGLAYLGPVLGPTTPLNDATGGLWVINPARQGYIQMNFTRMTLAYNASPFTAGNLSVVLNMSPDFGETASTLDALYYIVPGRDYAINGTTGPWVQNGAIAFFAGPDFVAADPFNHTVFFRYGLPFTPTWTGEDPASAGDMLIAPFQHVVSLGLFQFPVGPYQYFFASDGNHTVVFETDYVHAGYCPCAAASGRVAFELNASLASRPFVYYDPSAVTPGDAWRSGPGQAALFPLTNHTLEVVNVTGRVRGWVPLSLAGAPASVAGDIGFVQTPYPARVLVPVRSAAASGLVAIDLASLTPAFAYAAGGASWQIVGAPMSRNGGTTYAAWYNPADNRTHFVALNGTGVLQPQSVVSVPGRAQSVFYAYEAAKLFVETETGQVMTLSTNYGTANVTPTLFPLTLPSPQTTIRYAGSAGGTRYATLLSVAELLGVWTDPASATTALFGLALLPTFLAAGTWASGAAGAAGSGWTAAPGLGLGAVTWGRRT